MGFCSTLKYKHCEQHCLSHVFVRFTYHNFLSQQVLPQMADATAECRSASITEIRPRYVFCIIRQILDFPTHLYTAEAWFSLLFQADLNYIFSGGSGSSACWPCRARLGQRHVRAQHWTPLRGQHRSRGAPSHFESQEAYFGSVPPVTHPAHLPAVPRGVLHRLVVAEVEEVKAAVLGPARLLTACCHHTHRLLQPGKGILHPPHTQCVRTSSHFHRHLWGEGWTAELLNWKITLNYRLVWELRNTAFEVPTFSGFLVCSSPAWVIWWRCHKLADRFVVTKPVFSSILSSLHLVQKKFLGHASIPHTTSHLITFTCRIS